MDDHQELPYLDLRRCLDEFREAGRHAGLGWTQEEVLRLVDHPGLLAAVRYAYRLGQEAKDGDPEWVHVNEHEERVQSARADGEDTGRLAGYQGALADLEDWIKTKKEKA